MIKKKWDTGQSCIRKKVTSYKILTLASLKNILLFFEMKIQIFKIIFLCPSSIKKNLQYMNMNRLFIHLFTLIDSFWNRRVLSSLLPRLNPKLIGDHVISPTPEKLNLNYKLFSYFFYVGNYFLLHTNFVV